MASQKQAYKFVKSLATKWLNLLQRANPEEKSIPRSSHQGEANFLPLTDFVDILRVGHAFRLLTWNLSHCERDLMDMRETYGDA